MNGFKHLAVQVEPELYEMLDSYSTDSIVAKRYVVETALALFFSHNFEFTDSAICQWLECYRFDEFGERIPRLDYDGLYDSCAGGF